MIQERLSGGMVLKEGIGSRLKRIRKERGLTQKALTEKIEGKIDYTYIGKIERGEQLPSLKMLKRIGKALSVSFSYFFYDEEVARLLELLPKEVLDIVRDEKRKELLKTFRTVHETDIPFIVEIINILERHRKISSGQKAVFDEGKEYRKVAEETEEYGEEESIDRLIKEIELYLKTGGRERAKEALKRALKELKYER